MFHLADRISNMPAMKMDRVSAAVSQRQQQNTGKSFVPFLYGDTNFSAPSPVAAAIREFIQNPAWCKYSAPCGASKLLKAITDDCLKAGFLGINPDKNICVTNGAMEALHLSCLALLSPGDEAIIPAPYYFSYPRYVVIAGGTPVFINGTSYKNSYKLTPALLESSVTDRTKILFLNSPGNPTGSVYSAQELKALAEVLIRHRDIYVICDEVYDRFVLDGQHYSLAVVAPELSNRILTVNSISKRFGLSGERVGWVIGPKDIVAAIKRLKAPISWNTSNIAQETAYAALTKQDEFEQAMKAFKQKVRSGRDYMNQRLQYMGFTMTPASGGMFLFPQIPNSLIIPSLGISDEESMTIGERFAIWLIPFGTTFAPGIDMGKDNHFRALFAMDEQSIQSGMDSLEGALRSLNNI